ncbi:MAG TPA: helix-turn-helix transcriptional regulator [Thermoleophilia bacterium]|nr:helix-turn-helix transcriptional regulator [Thermoleophilia bacterium]
MSDKNNSVISEPKFALEDILIRSRKTLKQISEESGIGLKTIYELRSRKYRHGPRLPVLEALAPVLGTDIEKLREAVAGKDCARAQRSRNKEKAAMAAKRAAKKTEAPESVAADTGSEVAS